MASSLIRTGLQTTSEESCKPTGQGSIMPGLPMCTKLLTCVKPLKVNVLVPYCVPIGWRLNLMFNWLVNLGEPKGRAVTSSCSQHEMLYAKCNP